LELLNKQRNNLATDRPTPDSGWWFHVNRERMSRFSRFSFFLRGMTLLWCNSLSLSLLPSSFFYTAYKRGGRIIKIARAIYIPAPPRHNVLTQVAINMAPRVTRRAINAAYIEIFYAQARVRSLFYRF